MKQKITESDKEQEVWYKEAKTQTLATLPDFLRHLSEDYGHDYGTICHAVAASAIAAASAMNHAPSGGITGFQAGAVMWEFVRQWNFSDNKTGMKMINYDNMLYPQYYHNFQQTISPSTWTALQKEAARLIKDADEKHAKYLIDKSEYDIALAAFIVKYPDYPERKEYYDHLGMGTGDQWEAEREKEKSGFEFAPREHYEPIDGRSPVYRHWVKIVNGMVPFGYSVKEDL